MWSGRVGRAVVALLLLLLLGGCAKDPRPVYAKPKLADAQVAVIKGSVDAVVTGLSTWVAEVDGARVDNGLFTGLTPPTVRVAPGEHTIGIEQMGPRGDRRTTRFAFTFQPGHTYEVAGARITLLDHTANQKIVVE